jgi:hypothetical protein
MTTRVASALSMGDRQGQDGMVRVRRDQGAWLLVSSDPLRGGSAPVAFKPGSFVGFPIAARERSSLCKARRDRRAISIRELNLPHVSAS